MAEGKRIPVLVVSGFLGSGKTTLVRHLLQVAQERGTRLAVVSNEFGALGIDQALLGQGGEAYAELAGGCVCCQLSDELVQTLQMLWQRLQPEALIIETSGVALPFDTQLQLWREPVSHWVGDDMAVVVIDAEQVYEQRELEGTFEDQVSSADLLLLNKLDLIPHEAIASLEAVLRHLAPDTPVVHAIRGEVDVSVFFPPDLREVRAQRRAGGAQPRPHQHDSFTAYELAVEDGIAPEALIAQLQQRGMLRGKGFVRTSQGLRLVQAVGRRIELGQPSSMPPAALIGRVVIIARTTSDCCQDESSHRIQEI